jgi:hypothetical protein
MQVNLPNLKCTDMTSVHMCDFLHIQMMIAFRPCTKQDVCRPHDANISTSVHCIRETSGLKVTNVIAERDVSIQE